MSRPHDFLVDSVSTFVVESTKSDIGESRPVPASIPHLLSHLLLAVEDYMEGEPEAISPLRQACQHIVTDLAHALRAAHWSYTDAITLVTTFVDWSMRNTVCHSTDAVTGWITKQASLWILAVYSPPPNIYADSGVGASQQSLLRESFTGR